MECSSSEQLSSSDSEELVDSNPEETREINFASWSDTVFYEPIIDGSLDKWLDEKRPSKILDYKKYKWLSVINPGEKVDNYKSKWNRQNRTSRKIIKLLQDTNDHEELLDTALENDIRRGYWMIFCNSNEEFDQHWFYLVKGFYNDGRALQYSRIECSKSIDRSPGGIILIINENFTDRATILDLEKMCNKIAGVIGLYLGTLYYKLAFYTDLGKKGSGSYIITSEATSDLNYMENVEEWFETFEK